MHHQVEFAYKNYSVQEKKSEIDRFQFYKTIFVLTFDTLSQTIYLFNF